MTDCFHMIAIENLSDSARYSIILIFSRLITKVSVSLIELDGFRSSGVELF